MSSCLLVIDVQESFRQRPDFSAAAAPEARRAQSAYLQAQNALIAGCRERGVPIVRVFHVEGPAEAGNPFAVESGLVRPLDGLLPFEAAASFIKHRHSALVGTGLDVWLTQHGVRRLIISGIRTEQCCETTARHASDLGWQIDYVLEATHSFDRVRPDGGVLSAADLKQRTATVLAGRFAEVLSVDEALECVAEAV